MSDPVDVTPSVKKQTKRFAPVKRGAKTASTSRPEPTKTESEPPKSTTIGNLRPESVSSGRLQSVNEKKTRGSSIKMKFKPTVPLKRNKKEVSTSAIDEALNASRGRGGRGRGAGRGRGRGRGGLIIEEATASGIFSLGPSAVSRSGHSRPGYGGGASFGGDVGNRVEADSAGTDMTEMFTASTTHDTPVTFNHVSRMEGDVDPITLSQKVDKIPWMSVRSKKKEKAEVKVKKEDDMEEEGDKEEERDKEQEEEEDPRETVYMDNDSPAQNIFALDEKHRLVCVAEEELLYFQLPSVIPKFEVPKTKEPVVKDEDMERREENQKELPAAARKSTLEEAMGNLDLQDMPQGQVGKLIVYKSGKVKMQFGNVLMDVIQGMHSTFLENVMVVDHESDETKKAIELGHIVQKFVCSPNMDALLEQDEATLK